MGRAADKDSQDDGSTTVKEPAGKVEIDSEGNRVWRWAREVLENTSVLLKRLDNKDLALEPTAKVPVIRAADPAKLKHPANRGAAPADDEDEDDAMSRHPAARKKGRSDGGGGFDPYNSR